MFKHFASSVGKRIRSNRTRLFLAATTAILAAIAFTLASVAANDAILPRSNSAQASRPASTLAQTSKTYTLYSGFWRTDGSFVSTIRIKNVLVVAPMNVTPVLFMADGTPYMLSSVHVAVSGVATVNINDALATAPPSIANRISQFGSAALIYSYPSPGHVTAQMAAIDASRSLSYTYSFVEPMDMPGHDSKQVLEGLWWKHDSGVTGFVTLSNTTGKQQTAVLTAVHPGNNANPQQVTLASHSTQMLKLEDIPGQTSGPDNRAGGIRVEYQGSQGTVLVTGALANESEGYSANIPFWVHDMSSSSPTQITYASAGLMLGRPDTLMMPGFPKETTFSVYLSLRNTTEKPLDVALQLNYMSGMGMEGSMPLTRSLPAQHLAPFEARQVDLQGALNAAGLRDFSGSINLSTSFMGRGGDLVVASGSVDQTGTYVFEGEPQGISTSRSKYTNYWGVSNGNDTMFSLYNPTNTAQDILATFYYGDGSGKYVLPVHLEPQASTMIDMAMLIAEIKPDAEGHIIPSSVQEGSAQFASAKGRREKITLVIAGGVYNVSTATCASCCMNCCGDSNFGFSPDPILCPIGQSMQCTSTATDCYGNPVGGDWSSSNPSVMTVSNSSNSITATVTGVAAGQTTLTLDFGPVIDYDGLYCVQPAICPMNNHQGSGGANVTPTISQSTDMWYFGGGVPTPSGFTLGSTNATLTANGASSGTFQWTSSDTTKLLLEGNAGTVTKINVNTVGIISSGYSSSLNDVTVRLLFTPSGGSQQPAVNWTLSIDSPYKAVANGTIWPDQGVSTCTQPPPSPSGTNGYESIVPYKFISFFNLQITHIGFYEILGQPSNNVTNNWGSPTPTGSVTNDGTWVEQMCIAGSYNPHPLIPQSPLTNNLIQQIPQAWVVGTSDPNSGMGIQVQTDTQNWYIDHARHILVNSPVR